MIARPALLHTLIVTALLLGACSRPAPPQPQAETDPAVARALMAPILTDPDLVSLDRRFAVMSDPGPLEASLPPDDFAPSTIAEARAEAAGLIRGTSLEPLHKTGNCAGCTGILLADRARVLGEACADNLDEHLAWALRLPADLPIYPKAHLREAVGREGGACPLRGASFTAPVPAGEVLAFYGFVARKAGYTVNGEGAGGISGKRGSSRMTVLARAQPGGLSQFDLLVTG